MASLEEIRNRPFNAPPLVGEIPELSSAKSLMPSKPASLEEIRNRPFNAPPLIPKKLEPTQKPELKFTPESILDSPEMAKHPTLAAISAMVARGVQAPGETIEGISSFVSDREREGKRSFVEKGFMGLGDVPALIIEKLRAGEATEIPEAVRQYAVEKTPPPTPLSEQFLEKLSKPPTKRLPIVKGELRELEVPSGQLPFAARHPTITALGATAAEFADLRVWLGGKAINKVLGAVRFWGNKLPFVGADLGKAATKLLNKIKGKVKTGKVEPNAEADVLANAIGQTADDIGRLSPEKQAKLTTKQVEKKLTKQHITLQKLAKKQKVEEIGKKGIRKGIDEAAGKKPLPTKKEFRESILRDMGAKPEPLLKPEGRLELPPKLSTTAAKRLERLQEGKAKLKRDLATTRVKKQKLKAKEIRERIASTDKAIKKIETPGIPTTISKTLISAREAAVPTKVPTTISPKLLSIREALKGSALPVETATKGKPSVLPKIAPKVEIIKPKWISEGKKPITEVKIKEPWEMTEKEFKTAYQKAFSQGVERYDIKGNLTTEGKFIEAIPKLNKKEISMLAKNPAKQYEIIREKVIQQKKPSLKQTIKDINTILGERGAIGKGQAPTSEQLAARARLDKQVDRLVTATKQQGIRTAKEAERLWKEKNLPENAIKIAMKKFGEAELTIPKPPIKKTTPEPKETELGKYEDQVKQHRDIGKALIERGNRKKDPKLIKRGEEELSKANANELKIRQKHTETIPPEIDLPPPIDKTKKIIFETGVKQRSIGAVDERIARLGGKAGKEINRKIKIKNNSQQIIRAKFQKDIEPMYDTARLMKKSTREKIGDALFGGDPTGLSKRQRKIYDNFLGIYKTAADLADKYGIETVLADGKKIPWRKRKNPFSLMYDEAKILTPEFKAKAMKYLEANKERLSAALKLKKPASAEKLWEIWSNNRLHLDKAADSILKHTQGKEVISEKLAKNLEFSRIFEVPGWLRDPVKIAEAYTHNVSRRFAEIEAYGKGYKDLFSDLSKIYKSPHAGALPEITNLVSYSNHWTPVNFASEKISDAIRMTAMPMLQFSTPTSLVGGTLGTLTRAGISRSTFEMAKTLPQMFGQLSKLTGVSQKEWGQSLGFGYKRLNFMFIDDMLRNFPRKAAEVQLRATFFKWSEDFTKILASNSGKHEVFYHFKKFAKTKKPKFLEQLRDYTLKDSEIKAVLNDMGKLSKNAIIDKYSDVFKRGALEFANKTQGLSSRHTVPQWATSPIGKIVWTFSKVAFRLGRELGDHWKNVAKFPGRLTRFALLAPPAGYLAYEGQRKMHDGVRKIIGKEPLKEEDKLTRKYWLRAVAKVNYLGFWLEKLSRLFNVPSRYAGEALFEFLGPTAGQLELGLKAGLNIKERLTEAPGKREKAEKYYKRRGRKRPSPLKPLTGLMPVFRDILAPEKGLKRPPVTAGFPNIKAEIRKSMPNIKADIRRSLQGRPR